MNTKEYKVLKTVYTLILSCALILLSLLFIFLLIRDIHIGDIVSGRIFRRTRGFAHTVAYKKGAGQTFVKDDLSDFHILNRRIEIDDSLEYINIDWQKGDVRVRFAADVSAPYAEVKNGGTNILYKKSAKVLRVIDKRGKRRSRFTDIGDNSGCDIEVVLPSDYTLRSISVSSASGDIRLSEIRCRSVHLSSVNADMHILGFAENIDINTVNGDAEIKSRGGLKRLAVQSVNSDIRLFVPDGQKVRVHNTAVADKLEFLDKSIEAVSGEEAAEVSINSVKADVVVGRL
ncbi:DUF4097 family beta strand repeat-containing protein [Treponema sp. HNW]|uniref:DUF4097 family beta strand repeat-containing protein n=1 Tax=Treponema sp. HNW TaxID=3116654 RepID=UPI003D0DD806